MELFNNIPDIFFQFFIVLMFSLLIGLEQRRLQNQREGATVPFGTDRTFTFIGVLGFILFILDPKDFILFIIGGVILGILFGIYYYQKIHIYKAFGITKILVGLITYSLAPIVITQERWVSLVIVVSVLILVESKNYLLEFSNKLAKDEFVILAKFLIIAGVILPLLPDFPISDSFNISPYQIWLSLVVVAAISYFSYLLQKFVFRKSGLIISGMLGGLYSSTATTIILSKKSKEQNIAGRSYGASILIATSMMYLRVFFLMLIFNSALAVYVFPYLAVLFAVLFGLGLILFFLKPKRGKELPPPLSEKNPLELKLAVIFSALFILFSFLTNYTLKNFGEPGLNVLSYIVGFADIDPFLLNLFQGKYEIGMTLIAKLAFQAIIANNILKIIATLILAGKDTKKIVFAGLGLITIINAVIIFLL